jgi:hypothetical protein
VLVALIGIGTLESRRTAGSTVGWTFFLLLSAHAFPAISTGAATNTEDTTHFLSKARKALCARSIFVLPFRVVFTLTPAEIAGPVKFARYRQRVNAFLTRFRRIRLYGDFILVTLCKNDVT